MNDRKTIDVHNVEFMPFDRYGSPVPKMSWHIISYDQVSGQGSYVLKMDPGAQTCLLYTSPSPRDGLLSRMPSSA